MGALSVARLGDGYVARGIITDPSELSKVVQLLQEVPPGSFEIDLTITKQGAPAFPDIREEPKASVLHDFGCQPRRTSFDLRGVDEGI
ncbi:MAG: hypothetical protein NT155_03150 [Candidatus Staskawiczbacteria bacterium]|nr:hypothetical protein [Candidatus Staskawiczbacteria bacterium]